MISIKYYNKVLFIKPETFGDGTLKLDCPDIENAENVTITWCYDNDEEIFQLMCLVDYIKDEHPRTRYDLVLPYIPNARQDRRVSGKIFTLKTFSKIINDMGFDNVYVLDPHSDVSTALINRVHIENLTVNNIYENFAGTVYDAILYPDAGAAKKYFNKDLRKIIGVKHRDETGKIDYYNIEDFDPSIKRVLIRDDICASGGTFISAAKVLKARGVEVIDVLVSHTENKVLNSNLFEFIDNMFTTDSICTINHEKIKFLKTWRKK